MKRDDLRRAIEALRTAKELSRPLIMEIIGFTKLEFVPSPDIDTTIQFFEAELKSGRKFDE